MAKVYCSECGKATEHTGLKPKFCAYCSAPFDITVATASDSPFTVTHTKKTAPGRTAIPRRPIFQQDEDFMTDGTLPDLDRIEVEIELPEEHKEKVGDIWGSQPNQSVAKGKKKSGKVALNVGRQKVDQFFQKIYKKSSLDDNEVNE